MNFLVRFAFKSRVLLRSALELFREVFGAVRVIVWLWFFLALEAKRRSSSKRGYFGFPQAVYDLGSPSVLKEERVRHFVYAHGGYWLGGLPAPILR